MIPPSHAELYEALENFPHPEGVVALREFGIRYVILHRDLYLRPQARELEDSFDAEPGLTRVHRTAYESVYEVEG